MNRILDPLRDMGIRADAATGGRLPVTLHSDGDLSPLTYTPPVASAQVKEAELITIFRYAHMYPKTIDLLSSGKIDLTPLISRVFPFSDSVKAFELAAKNEPENVKIVIDLN